MHIFLRKIATSFQLLGGLCLFLSLSVCRSQVLAESLKIKNESLGYEIEAPASMEKIPSSGQVVLILRSKTSGFPNFNVIIIPGSIEVSERNLAQTSKEIVQSYQDAGIPLAQVKSSQVLGTQVESEKIYQFEIGYQGSDGPLVSTVRLIPSLSKHFIATWIELEKDYEPNSAMRLGVLNSFHSLNPQAAEVPRPNYSLIWLLIISISLVVMCMVLWLRYLMRKKS